MINNANIIRSIFLSLFLCLIHNLYGQTATPEYALEVSDAFFDIQYGITPLFEDITPIMDGETTCLYQIRYQNGEWCIISADMSIDPILAYGLSNIDENDEPEGFTDLVKWYTNQIAERISNRSSIADTNPVWQSILSSSRNHIRNYSTEDSLLDMTGRGNLKWGQSYNNDDGCSPSYNSRCPESDGHECYCGHFHLGCGAVAMGQIMWYWQWPKQSQYRTYHWEIMPGAIYDTTNSNKATEVANFLFDCAEASSMSYHCYGSWTVSDSIISAFKSSFNYRGVKKHFMKDWKYNNAWSNLIKSEIDNDRPVLIYGDHGTFMSGHYFVADGYKDLGWRLLFHINWGHIGSRNGFCRLEKLYEQDYDDYYNLHNRAIIGISPTYNETNITELPYSYIPYHHKRKEYAYQGVYVPASNSSLTVGSGAELTIEAGSEIILQPGFTAEYGSEVNIKINPNWQSQMAISVPYWPNAIRVGVDDGYCIETKNADSWEFTLINNGGAIVFQSAGSIISDRTCLWDGQGVPQGNYYGIVALKNSFGRRLENNLNILVLPSSLQNTPPDNTTDVEEQSNTFITAENFDSRDDVTIYPNPSSGVFSIEIKDDAIIDISVTNSLGEYVYVDENIEKSKYILNLTGYAKGVYYIAIQGIHKQYKKKIIIN